MRFALVGCGQIAVTHARAIARLGNDASLVACHDIVPERSESFAATFGCEPVLDLTALLHRSNIDAVTVCTPSGLHAEVGVPALLAGKHVLVEKPMDVTRLACEALIAASEASGALLSVVSQRRFDAASLTVREALQSGELGQLTYAECRVPWYRSQAYYDSADWRGTWRFDGGGALMNQGLHALDLMRWLCGPVAEVRARAVNSVHERIEVEDLVCALIAFSNGALGTIMASTSSFPAFPARVMVQGTTGGAVIEGDALTAFACIDGRQIPGKLPAAHTWEVAAGGTRAATPSLRPTERDTPGDDLWTGGHVAQLRNFIDAAERGSELTVSGPDAMQTVSLIEAIYRSVRTDQAVQLSSG